MSVNIPAAIDLNDQAAEDKLRALIGTPRSTDGTKALGNIPRTDAATSYEVGTGTTEGYIGNLDESGTDAAPSPDSTVDIDSSTSAKLFVSSWQFNAPNRFNQGTMASGGTQIRFVSGTGVSNYRDYVLSGIDAISGFFQKGVNPFVIDLSLPPDHDDDGGETGSFDDSNIEAYGMYTKSELEAGSSSNSFLYMQRAHVFDTGLDDTDIVKFTGTSDFDDIISAVLGTSKGTAIGNWVQKLSTSYFIPVAFQIGDTSTTTNFDDNGVTVISPSTATATDDDPRYRISTQGTRIYCRPPNSAVNGTAILSGTYIWGVACPWDFDSNNDSVITLSGTYIGMGDFTVGSSVNATGSFNLASGSKVISNGANLDSGTINGDCDIVGSTVTSFTGLSVTGAMDFDTAGTYTLTNSMVGETTNSSGGAVTLELINSVVTTNTGPNTTLETPVDVLAVNLIDDTRVQIYNVTKDAELDNSVVSGGSGYSLSVNLAGAAVDVGDTLRIRAAYQSGTTAKLEIEATGSLTTSGLSFLDSQDNNEIYNAYGLDGSTVSEFSWDNPNLEIDVNDTDNVTEIQRIGAWYSYYITTSDGIANLVGCVVWESLNSVKVITAMCNLTIDNTKAAALFLHGGRMYRDDDATIISATSNSIQVDYSPVYVAQADVDLLETKAEADARQVLIAKEATKFDPTTDTVANVTTVNTNTDMRGTDSVPTNPLLTNDIRMDKVDTLTNVKPSIGI